MRIFWALLLALLALPVNADVINGRVVGVSDGDTVTLLVGGNEQLRVRLTEIDAPESNQPYGNSSRQLLASMVHQRDVRVVSAGTDRYGRVLGRIYVGDQDVNRIMVREGAAWVYRQYMTDRTFLADEQAAKDARKGLWGLQADQQVPPWEWRRGTRSANPKPEATQSKKWSCDRKPTCGQMQSCEEAMFYLKQCGLQRLDRDKDGVPCESICRK